MFDMIFEHSFFFHIDSYKLKNAIFITILLCLSIVGCCSASELHEAAESGNIDKVKFYVRSEKNVNAKDKSGCTPLHYAAQNGHLKTVEWLILQKADINSKDNRGVTPLFLAAANGNYDIVKLLTEKGADVNERNNTDDTPIFWVMVKGEYIVEIVTSPNSGSVSEEIKPSSTVNSASSDNYKKIVSLLISKGAN